MSELQRKILKSSSGVAASTLLCRLLGLIRTMLEAWVLGGGALGAAWRQAFLLPNLFRTILGEGALGNALIPLITHTEIKSGRAEVRRELAVIFAALGALLALIVIAVSVVSLLLVPFVTVEYWRKALLLAPVVMPYGFFMCLVGISGAVLNTRKVFFLPSLGNLLLNVMVIGCLWLAATATGNDLNLVLENSNRVLYALGGTVLVSGLLHLGLMGFLLWYYGVWPDFRLTALKSVGVLKELFRMALPGLLGSSASQISFVIDQLLAGWISALAVTALYNTERLVYLPIGVFALSLGTVMMSSLSQAAVRHDYREMCDNVTWGLQYVQFVCVPLTVFLIVFRRPILTLLFRHGNFSDEALDATAWAMLFYAIGIPSFCSIKVLLPAYYSRKNMRTPLKCSLTAISANVGLNLILMWPLAQGGIALATVISSMINNSLLLRHLKRENLPIRMRPVAITMARTLPAALLPAAGLWLAYPWLRQTLTLPRCPADLLPLTLAAGSFLLAYLLLSRLFGCTEGTTLFSSLRRR